MKPQLPPQKVGNRSGIGSKSRSSGVVQNPLKRGRDSNNTLLTIRTLLSYAPIALKVTLAIATGIVAFLGYRAAASASFFEIKRVQTSGINRASAESIESVVRQDLQQTGVWRADLDDLSRHLEQLPWVRTAIVTRVLPDGIRVRIVEREPRAVVRTAAGRFMWVDEEAVLLEDMKPSDPVPTFFLRGWNEEETANARAENRQRVAKFLELQRDWNADGLSERVSEVNLLDLRDVRAQLAGDDSQIEVRLGGQDLARRLRLALDELDKQRQTPRGPFISYIDLSQGNKKIIGLHSGAKAIAESETSDSARVAPVRTSERKPDSNRADKDKDTKGRTQTKRNDQRRT